MAAIRRMAELVIPSAVLLAMALAVVLALSACRLDGRPDNDAGDERVRLYEEQRAATMRRQVPTRVSEVDGIRLYRVRDPDTRRHVYFTSAGSIGVELAR